MKLSELATALETEIKISQTCKNNKWGNYSADFTGFVEFKENSAGIMLSSVGGYGPTKQKALRDLVSDINKYGLAVINASRTTRKEVAFTKITL